MWEAGDGFRLILAAVGVCGGVSVLVGKEKSRVWRMMDFILSASKLLMTVSIAIFCPCCRSKGIL
jgi:hypothetical protein